MTPIQKRRLNWALVLAMAPPNDLDLDTPVNLMGKQLTGRIMPDGTTLTPKDAAVIAFHLAKTNWWVKQMEENDE